MAHALKHDADGPAAAADIVLPEHPTLDTAQEIHAQLAAALQDGRAPVLDAGRLIRMHGVLVITLAAAARAFADAGLVIGVQNAGDEFTQAFSDLDLFADVMKMEFTG